HIAATVHPGAFRFGSTRCRHGASSLVDLESLGGRRSGRASDSGMLKRPHEEARPRPTRKDSLLKRRPRGAPPTGVLGRTWPDRRRLDGDLAEGPVESELTSVVQIASRGFALRG